MKFTIITVSYNSGKDLINTCLSVINQSYKNLELIIIDGKSNDSSLSELKVINDRRLTIYSEKDHGIYDAMNKGIRLAQGDYEIFMNSGDFFANSGVLDEITKKIKIEHDVIIGKNLMKGRIKTVKSIDHIWKGEYCSHQSTLIKLSTLKKFQFDLSYQIAADFNMLYTIFKHKYKFILIDCLISKTDPGGISDLNRLDVYREYCKVLTSFDDLNFKRKVYFQIKMVLVRLKHPVKKLIYLLKINKFIEQILKR